MDTPKKTTWNGRTGFWMRAAHNGNVRVVNGTMYKLLSAKKGNILTRILSRHMHRQILRQLLYEKGNWRKMDQRTTKYPHIYGLIGLRARAGSQGLVSNTTLQKLRARKVHPVMSPNIYSSQAFLLLIGLSDGSALDTLRDFQNRRKPRQRPLSF
jgi:hypothetical protein